MAFGEDDPTQTVAVTTQSAMRGLLSDFNAVHDGKDVVLPEQCDFPSRDVFVRHRSTESALQMFENTVNEICSTKQKMTNVQQN